MATIDQKENLWRPEVVNFWLSDLIQQHVLIVMYPFNWIYFHPNEVAMTWKQDITSKMASC